MEETPSAADEQDRALVKQCLEGQRDAAGGLVDRYQKRLFNVALRMLGNVQDAEDVTQTVFLNAFLKLKTYDPKFRFFSWIYRMAVNESLNTVKRRKPTLRLVDDIDVEAPTEAEPEERVQQALLQLNPDDRAILVMKHFVFFTYEEIADVLDIEIKTVKSRLFTARERLRLTLLDRVQ